MFFNGLNDKSFEVWASDDEDLPQRSHHPGSPITVDSDVNQLLSSPQVDPEHTYLLVKNLPVGVTEREMWALFQDSISLEKVFILPKTNNVYLKFTSTVEISSIIASNEAVPMVYQGHKLKMGSVLKLPLDLNNASKVVLLTLYDEKIEVTAQAVHQIFKDSWRPLRIIVFKKKNFHVFMEFDSAEESAAFKDSFDNTNFNGFFYLKVQFTRKNCLNVVKNSPMEHDFTAVSDCRAHFQTVDFNYLESCIRSPQAAQRTSPNAAFSLQNFDDFAEAVSPTADLTKESPTANDQTLDTSEDKCEYFYLLHLSNLHSDLRVKAIFNLFSLYGNIEKISTEFPKRKATVFYMTEFEQMTAHHCLGSLALYGNELQLSVSKVSRTAPLTTIYPNLVQYKKGAEGRQVNALSKLRVINKPNQVLYVFNLTPAASLEHLKSLFSQLAKPEELEYSNESKNSALVTFKTVDEATRVLCAFKNTNVGDKSLKINFANNNLIKAKDACQRKSKFVSLQSFSELSTFVDFDPNVSQRKAPLWEQNPRLKLHRKPLEKIA